jgi:glycosyltransferase involved in cell wall biosynthesis
MGAPSRIAFVCPRWPGEGAVGGAETLLKALAVRAAAGGAEVTFLTTCAASHHTWENTRPEGDAELEGLHVKFFPVSPRDAGRFAALNERIGRGGRLSPDEEKAWWANGVRSDGLVEHLKKADYERVVTGPYLLSLTRDAVFAAERDRIRMVPCLHDEPFARLAGVGEMFRACGKCLFNAEGERQLAQRLFGADGARGDVVGMGMDDFACDAAGFRARHKIEAPFLLYCGRREPLKGTPLICDYLAAFRSRTGKDLRMVFTGTGEIECPDKVRPFVTDLGFVDEREKHDAMAASLAFFHPSRLESFGIVLFESWLAGRPCLVRDQSPVLKAQCQASNGGLWFRHYADFEEEVLLLLEKPEIADALGAAGRAFVLREYAWESIDRKFRAAMQ